LSNRAGSAGAALHPVEDQVSERQPEGAEECQHFEIACNGGQSCALIGNLQFQFALWRGSTLGPAGAINRVGTEAPWNIGKFYGSSYFVDPRGSFLATASEDKSELVVADMDLEVIEEVRRVWQFYRDRRPETYSAMAEQRP